MIDSKTCMNSKIALLSKFQYSATGCEFSPTKKGKIIAKKGKIIDRSRKVELNCFSYVLRPFIKN